jgi:hypothetical protein
MVCGEPSAASWIMNTEDLTARQSSSHPHSQTSPHLPLHQLVIFRMLIPLGGVHNTLSETCPMSIIAEFCFERNHQLIVGRVCRIS